MKVFWENGAHSGLLPALASANLNSGDRVKNVDYILAGTPRFLSTQRIETSELGYKMDQKT
jgi:hypothetical protein